jgi:hypothetical protein
VDGLNSRRSNRRPVQSRVGTPVVNPQEANLSWRSSLESALEPIPRTYNFVADLGQSHNQSLGEENQWAADLARTFHGAQSGVLKISISKNLQTDNSFLRKLTITFSELGFPGGEIFPTTLCPRSKRSIIDPYCGVCAPPTSQTDPLNRRASITCFQALGRNLVMRPPVLSSHHSERAKYHTIKRHYAHIALSLHLTSLRR